MRIYENDYAFTLTDIKYTGSISDTGTLRSGGERVLRIPKIIIMTFKLAHNKSAIVQWEYKNTLKKGLVSIWIQMVKRQGS